MGKHLPAEWHEQDAIIVAWPNEKTDWKERLQEVENTYLKICHSIADHQPLIILSPQKSIIEKFNTAVRTNIKVIEANYNDTWTRDYIGISLINNSTPQLVNFKFNAWGEKFSFQLDNQVNKLLEGKGYLKNKLIDQNNFVLEGGSIDSNGQGTILTTSSCLLSKNRNPQLSIKEIENTLCKELGVKKIIWLDNGQILGDDTDEHIDTLARFCNPNTIAYSIDKSESLSKMELELKSLSSSINNLDLVPLPLPQPIFHNNQQLPATYANFLITNKKVLVPTYNDLNDQIAIQRLQEVFTTRDVQGIDCTELIKQNGSLHCITMQVAKGTLNLSL